MKDNVYGVDVAKRVFQVHSVDPETGEIVSKQIKRADFLEYFANHASCLIGMEACGGAQHWARRLTAMGHEVKLMPGKVVKAFVSGNKNDVADARAIWLAVQQPGVKAVAVKTEEQQAVLALHRMRQQLVKFRTMQSNGLRGLLTEYGEVIAVGRAALERSMKKSSIAIMRPNMSRKQPMRSLPANRNASDRRGWKTVVRCSSTTGMGPASS